VKSNLHLVGIPGEGKSMRPITGRSLSLSMMVQSPWMGCAGFHARHPRCLRAVLIPPRVPGLIIHGGVSSYDCLPFGIADFTRGLRQFETYLRSSSAKRGSPAFTTSAFMRAVLSSGFCVMKTCGEAQVKSK
jgi:hypothetical protein